MKSKQQNMMRNEFGTFWWIVLNKMNRFIKIIFNKTLSED